MSIIDDSRNYLWQSIDDSLNLIRVVHSIMSAHSLSENINTDQRDFIVEWLFVKVHTSWEHFLENCFLNYMLGESTSSGYAPTRYIFPIDKQHAINVIKGTGKYIRWNDPNIVKTNALLYFQSGEPFLNVLNAKMKKLQDVNTIRNATVHKSHEVTQKFKSLVRSELTTAPLNVNPGNFLLGIKPHTIGTTFFNSYCKAFKAASKGIAPI